MTEDTDVDKPDFRETAKRIIVDFPTAKTPLLAVLTLQLAQTYLLEMMRGEQSSEGRDNADGAFQLVQQAIDLIPIDDIPSEH
jgi:hypothetical protein